MRFVVTGSLGNISKPLVIQLVQKGHDVIVVSSNPERQKAIEALDATAAIGKMEDADFLTTTFKNADAVYAMIPPNFKEFNGLEYYKRIAENYKVAVQNSAVKRLVFLSSWGAHLDKGTGTILGSHHAEQILNPLAQVDKVYIRPVSILYNLFNYLEMIKNRGIMGSNFKADDKIAWVHPNDIAHVISEALTGNSIEKLEIKYVSSDEKTVQETAEILGEAIGEPNLTWTAFTDSEVKQSLFDRGLPEHFAQDLVAINAAISSGRLGEDYEKNKPELGETKLTHFAKEFAEKYKQQ